MIRYLTDGTSSKRNPFEAFLLVACLASGIVTMIGRQPPSSISKVLPEWAQIVWAIFITFGAAIALAGLVWKPSKKGTGPVLEQVGLAAVGNGSGFYAIAVLFVAPQAGAFAASLSIALGGACLWRYLQIRKAIRIVLRAQQGDKDG